jgi:hypothetical protein
MWSQGVNVSERYGYVKHCVAACVFLLPGGATLLPAVNSHISFEWLQ